MLNNRKLVTKKDELESIITITIIIIIIIMTKNTERGMYQNKQKQVKNAG